MGETCGARLIDPDNVTKVNDDCKLCQEIQVKRRRLQKENDNIARWRREGGNFRASIEKAQREVKQLEETIAEMHSRRPKVKYQVKEGSQLPTMLVSDRSSGQGANEASETKFSSLMYAYPQEVPDIDGACRD
ncbi:hypothetical protein LTR47_006738 [Exophiala xenobiotica]|nr:hypothetical protein LTR72_003332 [Exophiala xenobiotica]KAK5232209.1 hypothetical protein LTR47_006738 [Exophiala xenobiotica]KAK5248778.1 hypothetical protein LTS06_006200 [Exophiala xenobiotica]KAK5301090.1 hypothetical protein LTR14_001488 [Exophiala xenobiotica]KAK5320568.1 hypothetical protein LTR93_006780 [Exophiala xenobiotica]